MRNLTPYNRYFYEVALAIGQYLLAAGVARRGVSWLPLFDSIKPGTWAVDPPREIVFHWRLGPFAVGMARNLP